MEGNGKGAALLFFGAAACRAEARSAILIEARTGRVLEAHNAHEPLPMASTTKIMTALLALEQGKLDDVVTAGPNAFGVKTGDTKAAGRCLVFAAERDGLALIGVVLNCPDWFDTAASMLDRGFDAWQMVTVPGKDETVRQIPVTGGIRDSVRALALQDVSALVKTDSWPDLVLALPDSLPAGVEKGQVIGSASLVDQGETLVTVPLYAAESVPPSSFRFLFARIGAQWLLGR